MASSHPAAAGTTRCCPSRHPRSETARQRISYLGDPLQTPMDLFLFTAALWWVTLQLARHAKRERERQAKETQRSLSISEQAATAAQQTADAAVSTSMPVLFPKVVGMNGLHPLIPIATPFTHESNIFIKFEN